MKNIFLIALILISFSATAQIGSPNSTTRVYGKFQVDSLGYGGTSDSALFVTANGVFKKYKINGGGGSDGNNYPTTLGFNSGTKVLTLGRNGLTSLTASIPYPDAVTDNNQIANGSGYITGNQNITLSGDITGSGTTSMTTTLANSGVTAGSYTTPSFTVDSKGRVSSATSNTINKSYVNLGNVDNTSDANKPLSTAATTALSLKQDNISLTTLGSGAASLTGSTLNIPTPSAGGSSVGDENYIQLSNGSGGFKNFTFNAPSSFYFDGTTLGMDFYNGCCGQDFFRIQPRNGLITAQYTSIGITTRRGIYFQAIEGHAMTFYNSASAPITTFQDGGMYVYAPEYHFNTTEPATPSSGGVIYVEGGSLKYKGSSGTVTVLGAP